MGTNKTINLKPGTVDTTTQKHLIRFVVLAPVPRAKNKYPNFTKREFLSKLEQVHFRQN